MREETSDTHVTGRVRVARLDDAIVVTMPGTSYSITYRKVDSAPSSSPQVSETISTLQSAGIRFALEPGLPQTRRRAILGGLSSVGFGRGVITRAVRPSLPTTLGQRRLSGFLSLMSSNHPAPDRATAVSSFAKI